MAKKTLPSAEEPKGPKDKPCPNCGHCPTCGQVPIRGSWPITWPHPPVTPYYPTWTTSTTAVPPNITYTVVR